MKPLALLLFSASLLAISCPAEAATGGAIAGRVVAAKAKAGIAGATVTIRETGATTRSGADGSYAFRDLPAGAYTLIVTAPNGVETTLGASVSTGQTTAEDIIVSSRSAQEEIVIQGQRAPQTVARAVQREAPNLVVVQSYAEIRKLPDISTAEAVRRVPGISLETDEGEGRYVNIRGLDADLNSTTFGGLKLPPTNNASPFGGYRAVTMDSIPVGLVGAITVTKSNLPDMDAEALGGTIEITPKTAPTGGQPFIQGNVGAGYEPLRNKPLIDVAVTAGGHFGGRGAFFGSGPFSIVLTGTYYEDHRGIDDVEPAYFNDLQGTPGARPYAAINNIQQRDYELNRKRHGVGIDLGYQPDDNNEWYIRAFEAGYTEHYKREFLNLNPDGNAVLLPNGQIQDTLTNTVAIQKALRDEQETSIDRVAVIGGRNRFGSSLLDYRIGYTRGTYHKPYDYNSFFDYQNPNATITYSPTGPGHVPIYTIAGAAYTDPTNYVLDPSGFVNGKQDNFDRELSFAANFQTPLHLAADDYFKLGLSLRLRHKRTTAQPLEYSNLPALPLTSVDVGGPETYYGGIYQNGPDIQTGALQRLLGPGDILPADVISADQQYLDALENVIAGYGEYHFTLGRLGVIGGVRVEGTKDTSHVFSAGKDQNGNFFAIPFTIKHSYYNVFPGIQLRYEIEPHLIARAAWSTTIARPGFNQSNPALAIDVGSGIVTTGNPNLKPATANSFDVSLEKYVGSSGIISAGLFYKLIDNYIVPRVTSEKLNGDQIPGGAANQVFLVTTFSNAPGKSYARGFEININDRFTFLPGFLSGFGVSANYTFVDSRFEIRPGEFARLPSSSKNTWNVAGFYEKGPVAVRLAVYSVSADLFGIGGDKTSDIYNAKRTSMDFGASLRVSPHWVAYFNAKNLLNTPHAFWQGTLDRPIQREFYRQTYELGVRFDY